MPNINAPFARRLRYEQERISDYKDAIREYERNKKRFQNRILEDNEVVASIEQGIIEFKKSIDNYDKWIKDGRGKISESERRITEMKAWR